MNSWRGTVLIGLVLFVVIFAAANSSGDDDDEAGAEATPTSTESPDGDSSGEQAPGDNDDGDNADPPNTGSDSVRGVAVTFDDGPHPDYTPRILDILAEHEVRAVFCVVGEQAERYPELVRRIVDEGHALCNHSFDHDGKLATRSDAHITDDLSRTAEAIRKAVPGGVVPYFRQPMMHVKDNVAVVAREFGYRPLNWTIDTRDWEKPRSREIVSIVEENLRAGAIILMHDGGGDREETVAALPGVIDAIDDAGLPIIAPKRDFSGELLASYVEALW